MFTAECSHTFHFHCIAASVSHGHILCPLCNAPWRELPFERLAASTTSPPSVDVEQLPQPQRLTTQQPADPVVFDDDEQANGAVVVNTYTDYSAVARDESRNNFAVLVHLKATGTARAPVDLVTVLDVSRSMLRRKLALLKQAMRFVVDILGPEDRLCVVSFSSTARRVTRLARMSDAGKALCVRAVESLTASPGTNIAEGLRTAAKVLDERRYRNGVSSVILLTDGQDNFTSMKQAVGPPNYAALIPPSFARTSGDRTAPIHTFGFGSDHDAAAMHAVAESTGGTFSFIENQEVIQDAFAQCVGGLLSVVVQDARLAMTCVHPGVRIVSVKSGTYESRVDEDGRGASVEVGEIYADEERRFLLFLVVPRAGETDGDVTTLAKVSCTYRDATAGMEVSVMAEDTVVARPEHAVDLAWSVEVQRELLRVEATEDMASARAAAEQGAYQEAVEILEHRWRVVSQSDAARGGDAMIATLVVELRDMLVHVSNRQNYTRSGRAHMLAGMSAHMHQRGSSGSLGSSSFSELELPSVIEVHDGEVTTSTEGEGTSQVSHQVAETLPYATPAILAMMLRSRRAREAAAEGRLDKVGEEAQGSESKVPEMNQ
jgi:hypothetical protein